MSPKRKFFQGEYMRVILILLSLSTIAYAHMEHMPGPHKGQIRMPGAFHTELVLEGQTAKVYLLDVNFKNPEIKNSSVILKTKNSSIIRNVNCIQKTDYFECQVPDSHNIEALLLKATRLGLSGKEVVYPLKH
jgi:hypothetical protein